MQKKLSLTVARSARVYSPLAILGVVVLVCFTLSGCHKENEAAPSVTEPPLVQLTRPLARTIVRVVGQPSFVEAYERTAVYPKMTAYIENWNVDIGDRVKGPVRDKNGNIIKEGQVLATLKVPELVEEWETKKAMVLLDESRIQLAKEMVEVAKADVKAAKAKLDETKATLEQYEASVERWEVQVKRLTREEKIGVVDPQVLTETVRQLKSSTAERQAAKATIEKAAADLLSKNAAKLQADVAVRVAEATLGVSTSEEKRLGKLVDYLVLPAPFDGVITARNANKLDFVLPGKGDVTAMQRSPNVSPSGSAPIYVVERTDIVRIFVDIPEHDANYVQEGTAATVHIRAYKDKRIELDKLKKERPVTVTRTAWALNVNSRTLRAEIDLHNDDGKILPGMYAYVKVTINRPGRDKQHPDGVLALPCEEKEKEQAISYLDDMTYCWSVDNNGRAIKMEIQTGISDGKWIEVTNWRPFPKRGEDPAWLPFTGTEQVILGDLSLLKEGEPVRIGESSRN